MGLGGQCNVSWGGCWSWSRWLDCYLEEVHLREKRKNMSNQSKLNMWDWLEAKIHSSLTLQPIASSVCKTTIVATVATAITLVSSRTTGQKVSTRTEPEISMAIRISVQRNHSNGMIHKTWWWVGNLSVTDVKGSYHVCLINSFHRAWCENCKPNSGAH